MAHAQKPDFVFRGTVQSTTGSWGVRISGNYAAYTIFWGNV